ncbi:MAG: 50S ribosomal protein L11 [Candidatus Pacebacteria bacterium]|nr:50S ribosomal protein L11 [Candidatus Paceibacterota bacterium]
MAKKIIKAIKVQIPAGKATPAPPLGPALGQAGVNIQEFCTRFNNDSKGLTDIVPVRIIVYDDKSYEFFMKGAPATNLIMKAAGITKGSKVPQKDKVGKLTQAQLREIAEIKMKDLNANSVEQAMKIIAGSARSMGVTIEE